MVAALVDVAIVVHPCVSSVSNSAWHIDASWVGCNVRLQRGQKREVADPGALCTVLTSSGFCCPGAEVIAGDLGLQRFQATLW